MKRSDRRLAPLAAALCFAAATAQAASVDNGKNLAERNCAPCHAIGAKGESTNPISPPFRDIHLRYRPADLGEIFQGGLLTHHPAMPEFRFNLRELEDIAAYMQSVETVGEARLVVPRGHRP